MLNNAFLLAYPTHDICKQNGDGNNERDIASGVRRGCLLFGNLKNEINAKNRQTHCDGPGWQKNVISFSFHMPQQSKYKQIKIGNGRRAHSNHTQSQTTRAGVQNSHKITVTKISANSVNYFPKFTIYVLRWRARPYYNKKREDGQHAHTPFDHCPQLI